MFFQLNLNQPKDNMVHEDEKQENSIYQVVF